MEAVEVLTLKELNQNKNQIVQLSPRSARVTLRPNHPTRVKFSVRIVDIPVDMYFVMDLSQSMEKYRRNLENTAYDIASKLAELTSRFRIGFGSFNDKPIPPFSYGADVFKRREGMLPSYSFRHQV